MQQSSLQIPASISQWCGLQINSDFALTYTLLPSFISRHEVSSQAPNEYAGCPPVRLMPVNSTE